MTKINELDKKERYYTAEFKSNFIQNHEAMQNLQNVPPMSFLTKIRLKHSCSQKIDPTKNRIDTFLIFHLNPNE